MSRLWKHLFCVLPIRQLKEAASLQSITLHQSFGVNTHAPLRETTLDFCQFIPMGQFVPEENHGKQEDPPSFLLFQIF